MTTILIEAHTMLDFIRGKAEVFCPRCSKRVKIIVQFGRAHYTCGCGDVGAVMVEENYEQ